MVLLLTTYKMWKNKWLAGSKFHKESKFVKKMLYQLVGNSNQYFGIFISKRHISEREKERERRREREERRIEVFHI